MGEPLNIIGLARARAIIDLIERTADPTATVSVGISNAHASVVCSSSNLDVAEVRAIFTMSPLELEEMAEARRKGY